MFWKKRPVSVFKDSFTNLATWYANPTQRASIHPIIHTIVNQISNDLLRCGFAVRFEGVDPATARSFESRLQERFLQLNLSKHLFEWSKQAFLSPHGALLLLHTKDASDWSSPIDPHSITLVEQINVIPGNDFSVAFDNATDPLAKNYQQPHFVISGKVVHSSRALWCKHSWDFVAQKGTSMVQSLSTSVGGFDSALHAAQRLLERVGALLFESDELRIDRNSPAVIQQLLVHIRDNLKSNGALGLRRGDKISMLSFENLAHFSHIYEFLLDSLSMLSGVPRLLLLGHQKSSLGSGRAHHEELIAYFQRIHGLQERLLVPQISYLVFLLLHESQGTLAKLSSSKYSFFVQFHPLQSLDPMVLAQMNLYRSQMHAADIASGKISAKEARFLDPLYAHLDDPGPDLGDRIQ